MAQDPRVLLQKADKAAQGATGGFSLFGGRSEKWENAADLYTQAANAFRVQKQSERQSINNGVERGHIKEQKLTPLTCRP